MAIMNNFTSGGAPTDELTATPVEVMKGYKFLGSGSDEEQIGTLELTGNALVNHVLQGETFYSTNPKEKLTGTMTVNSILSFNSAVYSSTAIMFTWQNPLKGPFSGVIIVGKTDGYPENVDDGTRYYKGYGSNVMASGISNAVVNGFVSNKTYYLKAFSYVSKNNIEWIHPDAFSCVEVIAKGIKTFTSSGEFTVPEGVGAIDIFGVGGGAGGGSGGNSRYGNGSGGGGGYTVTVKDVKVTPGQKIPVTIGNGGAAGIYNGSGNNGGAGGNTVVGNYLTAKGGGPGQGRNGGGNEGGSGGSGGGGGSYYAPNVILCGGGNGGSNGGAGASSQGNVVYLGGNGQGRTTRAFGESNGTLYAGGGGGGGADYSGSGGSGGGGAGTNWNASGSGGNGGTNTGGGGGGGCSWYNGGRGGAGIAIIRWGY